MSKSGLPALIAASVTAIILSIGCSGGNPCNGEGSSCKIDTMSGYCQIDNINGGPFCVPKCNGFFDQSSCSYDVYSSCYPIFQEKFACLGLAFPAKKIGEECSVSNECNATLACIDGRCVLACDDGPNHACPADGGTCTDPYGYGWKVCR